MHFRQLKAIVKGAKSVANIADRLGARMLLRRLLQEFSLDIIRVPNYIAGWAAGSGEGTQTLVWPSRSLPAAFPCLLEGSVWWKTTCTTFEFTPGDHREWGESHHS